jgi:hypothetical protein
MTSEHLVGPRMGITFENELERLLEDIFVHVSSPRKCGARQGVVLGLLSEYQRR